MQNVGMKMIILACCPCCGEAEGLDVIAIDGGLAIECGHCGLTSASEQTLQPLFDRWNQRNGERLFRGVKVEVVQQEASIATPDPAEVVPGCAFVGEDTPSADTGRGAKRTIFSLLAPSEKCLDCKKISICPGVVASSEAE